MTRFVFWETPPELVEKAAPLRANLAAIQMQWALMTLARKYRPDQPRVPAGNRDGGQWTDAGGIRLAGGAEDDEPARAGRSPIIENSPAALRQEDFNNSIQTLRRLEPGNPNLETVTDGSTPGQAVVDAYRDEAEAAKDRTADKIAGGHSYANHAAEFNVSSRSDFASIIRGIIDDPKAQIRDLEYGRTGFYASETNTLVFVDPRSPDGGTMFKPTLGQRYFDLQKGR